jgi:hypothetical protein
MGSGFIRGGGAAAHGIDVRQRIPHRVRTQPCCVTIYTCRDHAELA